MLSAPSDHDHATRACERDLVRLEKLEVNHRYRVIVRRSLRAIIGFAIGWRFC